MLINKYPGLFYLILGIMFILLIPLFLGGYTEAFQHMLDHIWYDITDEFYIHLLITGVIITIYGAAKIIKNMCC